MKHKIIDLHCDLLSHFTIKRLKNEKDIFRRYHYDNFKKGNMFLSVFNIWVYDKDDKTPYNIYTHGTRELLENQDILNIVRNYQDIKENKINYIIGLEGIDYVNDPIEIYSLYQYGARLISLTWNYSNKFAASITDDNDYGLTDLGKEVIKIMNELGIIVDISHLSDKAALAILELSTSPVIASHSNVRNLCPHKRNLTDDMIKAIAKTNGIIGMNSYPLFISDNNSLDSFIEHIDYIKNLVGIDCIALGFDFMDFLDEDSLDSLGDDNSYLHGLKNHSELANLILALQKHNYSKEEIDKICYKNALRVIKEVL